MDQSVSSRLTPYWVALAAVAVAAALRALLEPLLGPGTTPFVTFFAASAISAWYGGLAPGLAAIAASCLASIAWFIPPYGLAVFSSGARPVFELTTFVLMAGLIVALADQLHRASDRIRQEAAESARQRELMRITLASIGDGVVATDAQGRVTFMNEVAESLTGWTQQEARSRPLTEVFHIINEQSRQAVENPVEKVLRTGKVVGLANHTLLIARDGTERPIDDSAAPIFDAHGNVHGVVLVFVDATRQRRVHTALQQLAAIVEHSEDAVISKNRDGVITSWNAAAERLYGYASAEAIGRHIDFLVPQNLQGELQQIMARLWAGQRIEHWDTVRMHKDGTLVDVSLRISPIKDAHGVVIGASKVARDITQRKRTEAALGFLAETSVALAALVDRESALQQAAETMTPFIADFCVVYVMRPDGSIGSPAVAHRDHDKLAPLRRFIETYPVDWNSNAVTAEAWRTGQTQYVPDVSDALLRRLAPDDEQLAMLRFLEPRSVISVPLRIRDRTVGVISFAYAQSGRRYTEADVPFAEELGRRVAIAVDNAQLLASVKAADRQKDEFLAMLAHELRNPLAAIRYAVDATKSTGGEASAEMIEIVERQVGNLSHLIDDLLDISRISRGKIQLRPQSIDAAIIARRAAATIRPVLDHKRHQLAIDIAEESMPLHADPTRAEQIVVNLLTNAAKFTPEGGQITLRAYRDNGAAVIQVADTGIGIASDTLPHVFELFAQADRTLDRSQGGLGIGLTVARELAELHGGTIAAHSDGIGHGAEFTVRLPLAEHLAAAAAEPAPRSRAADARLRILVVDDNRDTALVESMLLKQYGHQVAVAHDGQSALDKAVEFKPHAVLLDIGLPVLNGYEVASRLRAQGFEKEVLIAVSGYGQADDRDRSLKAGFNHHLIKPVESEALLAILRQIRPEEAIGA